MNNILSIQVLRALAAIAVMECHFAQLASWLSGQPHDAPFALYPLGSGVDLFFVISGFIMVHSSGPLFGGGSLTFIIRRIARIVPLYWLITLISIPVMSTPVTPSTLLASLFFIPLFPNPIYGVGWTLNFEMFFYAVFGVALLLPKLSAVILTAAELCGLVIVGRLANLPDPLFHWSDPIIMEFVIGMGLALLYERCRFVLPQLAQVFLALTAVIWIFHFKASQIPSYWRLFEWGLPAAVLFGALVFGPMPKAIYRAVRPLGDASYSIYLIHPLVGAFVLVHWGRLHNFRMIPVFAAASVITAVIAWLSYQCIERPINRAARASAARAPEQVQTSSKQLQADPAGS